MFRRFNIDSRLSRPGELFFALEARRDGHAFVSDAAQRGALGAVISQPVASPASDFALVQVSDTLLALQTLAKKALDSKPVKVVGITGSIGKTTTKEFAAAFLKASFAVLKSEGNYNNHIGLPLSLLKLRPEDEVAVLEMGMSAAGEIARLTQIASPDVAVITNIHPVHLEFFNSLEEIALAKKEILQGMKREGTAVLNGDDPVIGTISKDWKGKKLLFGLSDGCDIRAENIQRTGYRGISFDFIYGSQREEMAIPFIYKGFLYNYLAAAAVGYSLSVPIASICAQTETLKPFPMRGEIHPLPNGTVLIDDSYNSNPAALESALKDLSEIKARRKVAVLGDMLELGKEQTAFHVEAGKHVGLYAWDLLVTVGPLSRYMAEGARQTGMTNGQIASFENSEEAADRVPDLLQPGDLVLVKGSRSIRTDKIVDRLKMRGN